MGTTGVEKIIPRCRADVFLTYEDGLRLRVWVFLKFIIISWSEHR